MIPLYEHPANTTTSEQLVETPLASIEENRAIAEFLAEPSDLNWTIISFELNMTVVRDVAGFTPVDRIDTIRYGRQSQTGMRVPPKEIEVCSMGNATARFQAVMESKRAYDAQSKNRASLAGFRFSRELQGFLRPNLRWAKHIDKRLQQVLEDETGIEVPGRGVDAMLDPNETITSNNELAYYIWNRVSDDYPLDMAWYLAERSQYSENWQRDRFQNELIQGKRAAGRLIKDFSSRFELPESCTQRAYRQLQLANFGAHDLLLASPAELNGAVLGDYVPGTLRIEIKLGKNGTIEQPAPIRDPLGIACHELFHASSAESIPARDVWRSGIRVCDKGVDANEGMTELLTRLSLNRVVATTNQNGRTSYKFSLPSASEAEPHSVGAYESQSRAMLLLLGTQPKAFQALFQAYYGFVPDTKLLADAFNAFDLLKSQVSGSIGS